MQQPETHRRYAVVEVTASHEWLTADGDDSLGAGWKALGLELETELRRCFATHWGSRQDIKVDFVEWKEGED